MQNGIANRAVGETREHLLSVSIKCLMTSTLTHTMDSKSFLFPNFDLNRDERS